MKTIEEREMDAHHHELVADMKQLADKYLAIFEWDVPEVDEALANRLIMGALRKALTDIEQAQPG